jgi:hypothetical protein
LRKGILLIPDNDEEEQKIIEFWTGHNKNNNTSNQSTLTNNNDTCSKCGVDIFEKYPEDEAKKIINYCKVKYKKTLCKDCQGDA